MQEDEEQNLQEVQVELKLSWSLEDSFAEIQDNAGTQFDPEVVLAFMQVRDRICSIQLAYPDEDE